MIHQYKFCLWLVNKLADREMSLEEIQREWLDSASNDEGVPLTARTFSRYRAHAESLLNVDIECDKSTNRYRLVAGDNVADWILSAMRVSELARRVDIRDFIMLENPPAGSGILDTVIKARERCAMLEFSYRSLYQETRRYRAVPLFLRLFRQRWYVTARREGKDFLTTFALERMTDVRVVENTPPATMPPVTPEEYYDDCFGVIHSGEPERIVVRAFWPQNAYLAEVPMHHSQRAVAENDGWTDYELYLRPTYDFKQELLWHRDKLAVISPAWLRDDMLDILRRMAESYATGKPHCKDE
ncbi:MAG: WYL domain-containing protein [Duncaniella sp.]|nr:WYL domain-containing protein [Duncaniella sp.]